MMRTIAPFLMASALTISCKGDATESTSPSGPNPSTLGPVITVADKTTTASQAVAFMVEALEANPQNRVSPDTATATAVTRSEAYDELVRNGYHHGNDPPTGALLSEQVWLVSIEGDFVSITCPLRPDTCTAIPARVLAIMTNTRLETLHFFEYTSPR